MSEGMSGLGMTYINKNILVLSDGMTYINKNLLLLSDKINRGY
jgi:hypothetical protein